MSRPLRIEFEGAWYHVMNRGANRGKIFYDKDDFTVYLNVLQEACNLFVTVKLPVTKGVRHQGGMVINKRKGVKSFQQKKRGHKRKGVKSFHDYIMGVASRLVMIGR